MRDCEKPAVKDFAANFSDIADRFSAEFTFCYSFREALISNKLNTFGFLFVIYATTQAGKLQSYRLLRGKVGRKVQLVGFINNKLQNIVFNMR